LSFVAPAAVGQHSWAVSLQSSAISRFEFVTVASPEHTVRVAVLEKGTGSPMDDVIVRLGSHRVCTDGSGVAELQVSKGVYDIVLWKLGYTGVPKTVQVVGDVRIEIEIELTPEPEREYWMG